jgi:hypothetical protein
MLAMPGSALRHVDPQVIGCRLQTLRGAARSCLLDWLQVRSQVDLEETFHLDGTQVHLNTRHCEGPWVATPRPWPAEA